MDRPFPPQLDDLWLKPLIVENTVDLPLGLIGVIKQFLVSHKKMFVLYGFKFLTCMVIIASIFISESFFSEFYMKHVYILKEKAPSLLWMLGILIVVAFGLSMFVAVSLYLLHLVFMSNYMFSPEHYTSFTIEASVCFGLLVTFALLIAGVLQKKTYFKYSIEGLRAIRALREIMLYLMIILVIVPYSIVLVRNKTTC